MVFSGRKKKKEVELEMQNLEEVEGEGVEVENKTKEMKEDLIKDLLPQVMAAVKTQFKDAPPPIAKPKKEPVEELIIVDQYPQVPTKSYGNQKYMLITDVLKEILLILRKLDKITEEE